MPRTTVLLYCEEDGSCPFLEWILYLFHGTVAAIVSHGIVKERAVPPKEIDLAMERKQRFAANPGKHRKGERTE